MHDTLPKSKSIHSQHPYDELTPDFILAAVDSLGLVSNGRLLALNSFENRVYQVGVQDHDFVIAKFYRPHRWSDAAIQEEHDFTFELADAELPIITPLRFSGQSLHHYHPFRFSIYPRLGGRSPELEGADTAAWMGRILARIHLISVRRSFSHRGTLSIEKQLSQATHYVLTSSLMPKAAHARYLSAIEQASSMLLQNWQTVDPLYLRLHGDCHPGNVLWNDQGPLLLDFDDACSGPAIQDLWMLLSDDDYYHNALLDGYAQFRDLDLQEIQLIPVYVNAANPLCRLAGSTLA
jgi:Ser/Thr protein kinase RdoA (MazF antagonist)